VQQLPGERRDHDAAGDADDRQRDAEEAEHVRAHEQRAEQQEEAVDRDAAGERVALGVGKMARQAQEDRRAADRVHDRKQRGIDQQKRVEGLAHRRPRLRPSPVLAHASRRRSRGAIGPETISYRRVLF